jgi:hypothetical protein
MLFETKNLDKLIFMNKNWPFDLWIGCVKSTNLAYACEVESDLITELEVEFHDDEIDHKDFFDLNEVFQIFSIVQVVDD